MMVDAYVKDYLFSVHQDNADWRRVIAYVIECSYQNVFPSDLSSQPNLLCYIHSLWNQAIQNIIAINFVSNFAPTTSEWKQMYSSLLRKQEIDSMDVNDILAQF